MLALFWKTLSRLRRIFSFNSEAFINSKFYRDNLQKALEKPFRKLLFFTNGFD